MLVRQHNNCTGETRKFWWSMLTAGMTTRAVAHGLNVLAWTIANQSYREFISTSNRPQDHRSHVTPPAQDLHILHLHLQDGLRPATRTDAATIRLHIQTSAPTVRNHLREIKLRVHRHLCGLHLPAVRHRIRLQWVYAHIWWGLTLWRGVPLMDESWFSLDGADFSVYGVVLVSGWSYGMGRCMSTNTGAFYWWHFECREIAWPDLEAIHPPLSAQVAAWYTAPYCKDMHTTPGSWNVPVPVWPEDSLDMSMFVTLWISVDDSVFQFLPISGNFA